MLRTLRKHLTLAAVGGSQQVVTGNRRPLGYQQLTLDSSTAQALTLPTAIPGYTANFCVIDNQDASVAVRWRDDGTDPTTALGNRIPAGGQFQYAGDLAKIKFIGESATPKLNVSVYA